MPDTMEKNEKTKMNKKKAKWIRKKRHENEIER